MNLKQRFLTQNILILIGTIVITSCFGFAYVHFYNLLNESHVDGGASHAFIVVMKSDDIVYNSEDFTVLQIKEILMNLSIENNYYEYENRRYGISEENFHIQDGDNYKIITLNEIISINNYYSSFITFVFMTFLIVFIVASVIVQKQYMKNIIVPITNLTNETENLRIGELETTITDSGYGEVRELGIAIEQLRLQLKNSIYYQQRVDENRKFLISSISHDLKTPVTSIIGYIDGVLDGVADTDEKKQYYLSKAIEKTKMINTMIEDLLLYSKLDLNQMTFENEKVNIVKYLENCIEDSSEEFMRENKRILFENKLSTSYFVIIDIVKFKRVIQNILDNAKRSIETKTGQLKVILRETNTSIIIEFKDNGIGISIHDLPHVFDRFYRADTAREVKGSSGLGLAISKQIIEGLNGRIWAVSENGQGASIIISLKKVKKGK
ncbi:signal transduction histidine kinase [Sedimentibacter acidaminivorans]|uniref:histidine kinase n=1 Tax=Sedimentibacter acidaminivorans TaxID=913099 RepID=A0ABS4GCK9_9FIRM|nr:HAMP domain-containing sensor histidine kinase [Sedimentibacter acidaminivorans]MBP1925125.1 signal transduction histidine kinase [Sedimentibacter acidaminivorans]